MTELTARQSSAMDAPAATAARTTRFEIASSSGMFTHLQLKPRVILSLCFVGWSAWLREHAVPHGTLIRRHDTGFVPIGFHLDYAHPASFFECDGLAITTQVDTWTPARFHTLQEVDVTLANDRGIELAKVHVQEIGMRILSQETLAAEPAALSDEVAQLLHALRNDRAAPLLLHNRPVRHLPPAAAIIDTHEHEFVVHRHACEAADQWYSEHVTDYAGESREDMVYAKGRRHPLLRAGLARRIERLAIGLRRPYQFLDRGKVFTTAYRMGGELHFVHELRTSSNQDAGDVVEIFDLS
jgi:hypothetical protein